MYKNKGRAKVTGDYGDLIHHPSTFTVGRAKCFFFHSFPAISFNTLIRKDVIYICIGYLSDLDR